MIRTRILENLDTNFEADCSYSKVTISDVSDWITVKISLDMTTNIATLYVDGTEVDSCTFIPYGDSARIYLTRAAQYAYAEFDYLKMYYYE